MGYVCDTIMDYNYDKCIEQYLKSDFLTNFGCLPYTLSDPDGVYPECDVQKMSDE